MRCKLTIVWNVTCFVSSVIYEWFDSECIVLYPSSWMLGLYFVNPITDLSFSAFDQKSFHKPVTSRAKWSLCFGQYGVFFPVFLFSTTIVFPPPFFTPPVLLVCQLPTNHLFVGKEQWHLEHGSISSCYGDWGQICGKMCLRDILYGQGFYQCLKSPLSLFWCVLQSIDLCICKVIWFACDPPNGKTLV